MENETRSSSAGETPQVAASEIREASVPLAVSNVLPPISIKSFAIIAVAMVMMVVVVIVASQGYFKYWAPDLIENFWLAPPTNGDTTPVKQTARSVPVECKEAGAPEHVNQILRQRAQMVEYGDGHRKTAIALGAFFYGNVFVLGIFGLISILSLAVIAKTGLDRANGNLVAIFLLATGIALLFQTLFGVFQQKSNIDANTAQAISWGQLVGEVDTYCASGKVSISDPKPYLQSLAKQPESTASPAPASATPTPGNNTKPEPGVPRFSVDLDPPSFIAYIDWQMKTLGKFSILLDEKQLSTFMDAKRFSLGGL